ARVDVAHGILAGPGHVDRHRRDTAGVEGARRRLPILLPAIHATPLQYHRRTRDALRNLQVPDELLVLEGDLYDLERRVEVAGRLVEGTQRVAIRPLLARAGRSRIAGDAEIVEGEVIGLLGLAWLIARGCKLVA